MTDDPEATQATPFADAIAVRATGRGMWRADIAGDWRGIPRPQGGVMAALALSALRAHLGDPGLRPRTAAIAFPSSIKGDAVDISTDVIRLGKSVAQTRAEVRDAGGEGDVRLDVIAAFGRDRASRVAYTDIEFPEVPDATEAAVELSPFGEIVPTVMPPIVSRLERRKALGTLPWDGEWRADGQARVCRWMRFRDPALHDGLFDPLALAVVADLPGPAVWTKLGPDDYHALSSVQMTIHFVGECNETDPWVLADYRSSWAGDGYCTTDTLLWDRQRRLLAICTQLMALHRGAPPWTGLDRR